MPVKIFFCYAHEDELLLDKLKAHLKPLQRQGRIDVWHDRDISAGTEWEKEIKEHLDAAQIILLLVSPDFMNSDYCYSIEMKRAIERHEREEAYVIPIILRHVYWQGVLGKLQALPTDAKPVSGSSWRNRDEAFLDITVGILDVIEEIDRQKEIEIQEEQLDQKKQTTISTTLLGTQITDIKSPRKKALLILTAGQPLPDILMLQHLQPELVIIIAPQEGWRHQKIFSDVTRALPSCKVEKIYTIDASNLNACMQACVEACLLYPEWDWVFTISSSTKIMSLAAYEIAKQRNIPLWLVDGLRKKVHSLVREEEVDAHRFFQLTVDEYMRSYGYTISDSKSTNHLYQSYQSNFSAWRNVTQELIRSPDTETIRNLLRASSLTNRQARIMLRSELKTSSLLQSLEQNGLLEITQDSDDNISCSISYDNAQFLMGGWLEIYVWHEVIEAGFADDCRWGFHIMNGQVQFEIDLAIIYKTRLLIVECKTAPNTFKDTHLARLDSTANLLGGSYVSKIFVTNEMGTGAMFESFCEKARLRNIVVITKEALPDIATILRREVTAPSYMRIESRDIFK